MSFSSYFVELFILLFADDIILSPETVVGLQNELNNPYHADCNLKLKANMNKRIILVFIENVARRHLVRGGSLRVKRSK